MRTKVRWAFRVIALIAAVLTTVQPVLGSFSFFRFGDSISYDTIHMEVGVGIYYSSILLVVLALFTRFRRRWIMLGLCIAQFVASQGQLFLGVESDTNAELLAYHIPLGVLILILAYVIAALSFGVRLESSRA